jgi:hypothetical protein
LARRALGPLGRAGAELLRSSRFDLVFFSTTQYRLLELGPVWRRAHGVPYAVDWQDPWMTDYYERPGAPPPPGGWRYRFAQAEARTLEGPCLRAASGWVGASPAYERDLQARYPWFAGLPRAVIPFGFDPDDYDIAARVGAGADFDGPAGTLHIASVGAVGPIMRPALEVVCAAARRLREAGKDDARFRLHFIGTSYAPPGAEQASVLPLAAAHGVADVVREIPARLRYFGALQTMRRAGALLLLGSDDPGYNPSKIAAVAFAGRPVLACVGHAALAAQLRQLGLAGVVETGASGAVESFAALLRSVSALPAPPAGNLGGLTAAARTRELALLLDAAWRHTRDGN